MQAPPSMHENAAREALRNDARPTASVTARRWAIWSLQLRQGMDPCFGTEARFVCRDTGCPWWDECQELQAEWQR